MKQKLTKLQGKICNSMIIVGDFNIPLTIIDRTTRQKTNKDIDKLNTIKYLNLIDIHRTLHPSVAACMIFSRTRKTFSRIDHMLSDKTNLDKFKRIEIIQVTISVSQQKLQTGELECQDPQIMELLK